MPASLLSVMSTYYQLPAHLLLLHATTLLFLMFSPLNHPPIPSPLDGDHDLWNISPLSSQDAGFLYKATFLIYHHLSLMCWFSGCEQPNVSLQPVSGTTSMAERQNNGTEHRALNKFLFIRSSDLWQGCQEYTVWKDSLFSKRCWEKWVSTWPKNEITHLIYTYTKIHSQWVNNL